MNTISKNNPNKFSFVFLFGFGFLFVSMESQAASFDCTKTSTKVESLVCADAKLSELDDDLARVYKEKKAASSDITKNQRDWLINVRNQCATNSCLEVVYKERLSELKNATVCLVKEIDILGSWVRVQNGFFEEMMISYDNKTRVFNSWLHQHPEMSGTWAFDNCFIKISGPGKLKFNFKAKRFKDRKLYLLDDETGEVLIYKKTK